MPTFNVPQSLTSTFLETPLPIAYKPQFECIYRLHPLTII